MTPTQLAEIEARAKAATEGPWDPETLESVLLKGAPDEATNAAIVAKFDGRLRKDARFISHARQDIPDLIAHIRELETALGEKNEEVVTRLEQRMERELDKRLPNG